MLLVMIYFSPYGTKEGFSGKLVCTKITIKAPVKTVFDYLGDSKNAVNWSTFVHHISPINAEQFNDGEVGSQRRCFKNADEKGIVWDEEIIENLPNKKRKLSIFNAKGFPLYAENLRTEQIYSVLDPQKCGLSFSLFFEPSISTWLDELKMYFAAYWVDSIFKKNLENIKRDNE